MNVIINIYHIINLLYIFTLLNYYKLSMHDEIVFPWQDHDAKMISLCLDLEKIWTLNVIKYNLFNSENLNLTTNWNYKNAQKHHSLNMKLLVDKLFWKSDIIFNKTNNNCNYQQKFQGTPRILSAPFCKRTGSSSWSRSGGSCCGGGGVDSGPRAAGAMLTLSNGWVQSFEVLAAPTPGGLATLLAIHFVTHDDPYSLVISTTILCLCFRPLLGDSIIVSNVLFIAEA